MNLIAKKSTGLLTQNANFTVALPLGYIIGDLLMVCLTNDNGGAAIVPPSGWAMIGTGFQSDGGIRHQWAYKFALSGSETDPTFTGYASTWVGTCLCIRDADSIHLYSSNDWNASLINASPVLTTTQNDCIVFYSWGSDGENYMEFSPEDLIAVDKYALDSYRTDWPILQIIGYRNQLLAGTIPLVNMFHDSATEGGSAWCIAIKKKVGTPMPMDIGSVQNTIALYNSASSVSFGALSWFSLL